MGQELDTEHDETDLEEADRKGKVNIVKNVVNDPEVQNIIKGAMIRETVKNGILMSAFLVGIIFIFNAVKQILGVGPLFDLSCGIAMVAIGAYYILFSMRGTRKK
jgi:hypothetical protein